MSTDQPIQRHQMFDYQWAHRWTMCRFLQLRDFRGERTNQIMRSITVVIRAIHLQKEEISCNGCYDWRCILIGCFEWHWILISWTFSGLSRSLQQNVCRGTVNFFQVGFRLFFTTCKHTQTFFNIILITVSSCYMCVCAFQLDQVCFQSLRWCVSTQSPLLLTCLVVLNNWAKIAQYFCFT